MDFLYDRPGGEPYLTIPGRPNLIITPRRPEDVHFAVKVLNNFEVARWLFGPPYPYTLEMAIEYSETAIAQELLVLKEIQDHSSIMNGNGKKNPFVSGCPVGSIREIQPDTGEEVLIGCIGMRRYDFLEIEDDAEREATVKANEAKEVGDDSIAWAMGNFLDPAYHGRGITTDAARAMIQWGKKHMNMKDIRASMFDGNIASRRVYEKIGFAYLATRKDALTRVESKGGGKITIHVLQLEEH
ncbi:hypothetical protein MaudCBS49596_003067 [Microsporum audouinii]